MHAPRRRARARQLRGCRWRTARRALVHYDMFKQGYLRRTDLGTECDACGVRIDLMTGGTCERCKRILCARHLHGSWLRRMRHELGGPAVCVRCAAEQRRG